MTRIDFYQLDSSRHKFDQIVCRLCEKAYENKQLTLLLTHDEQQSHDLNRKLWTFSDDSFLPHDSDQDEHFITPILIQNDPDPKGDRQLLINLSDTVPSYFAQFERVIEIITDQNKANAREHYSFYKQRGYPLTHVNL